MRYVGGRRSRSDGRDKVLGATRYAADQVPPGALHARIVPSVYAHARIRSIDWTAALAMPGVVAVLTASDFPIEAHGPERHLEPLAREEVVFVGQPVALVLAESEAAAADAVGLVEVDLEPLEPIIDVLAAAAPGAAPARTYSAVWLPAFSGTPGTNSKFGPATRFLRTSAWTRTGCRTSWRSNCSCAGVPMPASPRPGSPSPCLASCGASRPSLPP